MSDSSSHKVGGGRRTPLEWLIDNPIKSLIIIYFIMYYIWYITGGPVSENKGEKYIGPEVVNGEVQFNYYNDLKYR